MRMKNKLKKGVSLVLASALTAASLSACGSEKKNTTDEIAAAAEASSIVENDQITYPLEGGKKLSYAMTLATAWSDRYDSFAKLPLGQKLQEDTGVELDMVHVENKQAMNLLLASGEFTDILGFNFQLNYTGGEAKAIADGIIYPMSEEFVQKNAPDYWKVISSDPDILRQVKTPEGDIYGFAFILGDELLKTGSGLFVRDDWCKELGIELPETADEYYEMLKAFKEKKGVEIPLCVNSDFLNEGLERGYFTSPFGLVTTDIYVDNGTVKFGYAQPEYKGVLEWFNKLYKEGLLDPNFSTVDKETIIANMLTGKSGASSGACGSVLGTLLSTNQNDPNYSLAGIKNLVAKKGDRPMYGHYNTDVVGGITAITTACKDPATAAAYLNYGYTEEGHMLYNFGTEGVSYEMQDGKPIFTDLVMDNPDGLTPQQALSEYQLAYGNGPFVQDKDYLLQYYKWDAQKDALNKWSDTDAKKYKLPRVTVKSEDTGEYTNLISELETYRDEMTIKFIRGEESLDNFDQYLSTLKSMGIDRAQEIVQQAVEEYNAR
ncbi:MAG: extracellular solute-binding protein [Lachnospiraceae bacterium]|nr:extracellular solute-binding protein [Lachnospiraceae bacterium]